MVLLPALLLPAVAALQLRASVTPRARVRMDSATPIDQLEPEALRKQLLQEIDAYEEAILRQKAFKAEQAARSASAAGAINVADVVLGGASLLVGARAIAVSQRFYEDQADLEAERNLIQERLDKKRNAESSSTPSGSTIGRRAVVTGVFGAVLGTVLGNLNVADDDDDSDTGGASSSRPQPDSSS